MERDTRGMLGGGPASQYPRLTTKQIRGALASHCHLGVIALSTDVCVLAEFLPKMRADECFSRRNSHPERVFRSHATRGMANFVLAGVFITSKPRRAFRARFETPLSREASSCP
jgi:hypothetical protein